MPKTADFLKKIYGSFHYRHRSDEAQAVVVFQRANTFVTELTWDVVGKCSMRYVPGSVRGIGQGI